MERIVLFFFAMLLTISASAQNWTKEMQKDFRKSKDVAVVVDLTKAMICGFSYEEFPACYSIKKRIPKEYGGLILEDISNEFKSRFRSTNKLSAIDVDKAKYVVHYDFHEITDKGAFNGVFYVMCGDNKSAECPFKIREGKWNDFETLVMENIEKFFKGNLLYDVDDAYVTKYSCTTTPFTSNLHNYK